ncbi:MAG: histidinol-phosphatase [Treponema sp.]|nr:histidinol-phosphatase [Spirochaetia bacterium]MDD7014110.1 histidinol-phosphatase [Spirochaetales bacterium]MDY4901994.1 histidinol-phosphatase [Treponema sp.]
MQELTNFHTHTQLCKHAFGSPYDYVKIANSQNCTCLGFSDHCPYPENFYDYWQDIRMSKEEIPVYLEWISQAKQIANFPVYTGYECEWDYSIKEWYVELKEKHGAQYLALGPHWVTVNNQHIYILNVKETSLLNAYTDQLIQGMESGIFSFVAHPDLFMAGYKEWDSQSKSMAKAIIQAAKTFDIPLEINGLGMHRNKLLTSKGERFQYPYLEFWQMAADENVKIICNSDAHNPADVIKNKLQAKDFALSLGITPVDYPADLTK